MGVVVWAVFVETTYPMLVVFPRDIALEQTFVSDLVAWWWRIVDLIVYLSPNPKLQYRCGTVSDFHTIPKVCLLIKLFLQVFCLVWGLKHG